MDGKTNSTKPLISVLLAIYEEPIIWVRQAINSILNQTYNNFEFVIVNDNSSSKETQTYLNYLPSFDNRIIILTNHKNLGLTKSLNIGLKHCRGKYIARMDADDISLPERFERQVSFMETHPDVVVCGANVKLIGKKMPFYIKPIFYNDLDIRGQLFHNSGFVHPSVFIRKSVLDEFNICYDENFISAQDYKLWFDLKDKGKFANLKERLLMYRISDTQVTSKLSSNQRENRKLVAALFKKAWTSSLKIKELQLDKNTNFNKTDKILLSYYQRSIAFQNPSFLNLMSTALSFNLKITLKERLSLCCKALIGIFKPNKNV